LKSWLTRLDIDLPAAAQSKTKYVSLLYSNHALLAAAGRQPPAAKGKGGKKKK
jgi:hypothetical protein